ncbi:MAG TPA: DNA ligase D [Nitrososphaeraceae archaeon]|nr:DNA ligase D [Nitrososphaeraceae archaeon]
MMLEEYNKKRNFDRTPEPRANKKKLRDNKSTRFVVQKHDATKLHYDFRLEDTKEGILKSWAIPKGISLDSKIKRLAILTEDHPLDYLLFEGVIPEGSYGAGTVIVWDTGTYTSEMELSEQFNKGKITFTLFGQKLRGKFTLVKTYLAKGKEGNQWLLMKSADEFESKEDLTITKPKSVLTSRINEDLERKQKEGEEKPYNKKDKIRRYFTNTIKISNNNHLNNIIVTNQQQKELEEFPTKIKPMLSTLVDVPFNSKNWVFEVKWDGVRSILFYNKAKGILELQSRNGRSLTYSYPELVDALTSISPISSSQLPINCKESVILDGEIVVLDNKTGLPSFQNHQRRMNVDYGREIGILSRQMPATYYFFDILYLDGKNLQDLPFLERRLILSETIKENAKIKISDFIEEVGTEVFDKTKDMGLEGVIAKNKSGKYVQGRRSNDWLKIKHIKTQDCVVIGYTRGEGNRENYFGSLLLAVNDVDGKLHFVGHTGSGFDFQQLRQTYNKLQEIRIEKCPIDFVPYTNQSPVWIKPELVVEIKFSNWTYEKIMRTPVFLRFREDKVPKECLLEMEKYTKKVIKAVEVKESKGDKHDSYYDIEYNNNNNNSNPIFSNLDKIFWDKTTNHPQLTKKDLIEYYDKISKHILPYLKDRPLSLCRYPDGIKGKSFYHKNWNRNNKPTYVETVKVYSESREGNIMNYIICNNKETLLWLVNLGCIEMHPWYSRIKDFDACKQRDDILDKEKCGLNFPDFIIFDLDPYIYSGNEKEGRQEPEYNFKAFQATVDIAFNLKDLFDEMNIESYVKTSGKTGLHIFVPIVNLYTYEQTRSFAEIIGKILIRRYPGKITMEWDTTKRTGKVFFDHNQNARGKTIASIFSPRPTDSATVSVPIKWEDLPNVIPTDFTILNVPDIINKKVPKPWIDIMKKKQDLNKILENVKEVL